MHEVVGQMKRRGEVIVGGNNWIRIEMGREGEVVEEGGPLGPWVGVRVPIGRVVVSEGGGAGVELWVVGVFDWGRGREVEWVVVAAEEFVVAEEEEGRAAVVVVVVEEEE